MRRVAVTRRVRFEAAHRLWSTSLDETAGFVELTAKASFFFD